MPRKSSLIKDGNKNYLFTPGTGGSLVSVDRQKETGMGIEQKPAISKLISSPAMEKMNGPISEQTRKRRNAISIAILSTRG